MPPCPRLKTFIVLFYFYFRFVAAEMFASSSNAEKSKQICMLLVAVIIRINNIFDSVLVILDATLMFSFKSSEMIGNVI